MLLRDGTELNTGKTDRAGTYETRNFPLSTNRGSQVNRLGRGRLRLRLRRMASSRLRPTSRHKNSTSLGKGGQGFVGQRLTGNRGGLFLSLSSELREGGRAGWNQRTTEKGQEPTSKTVIPTTRPARKRAMHLPIFSPCLFPHQPAARCGGQGREGTRRVVPRKITRGTKQSTTCHPPTQIHTHTRLHNDTHTHTHTRRHTIMHNTQAGLLFR